MASWLSEEVSVEPTQGAAVAAVLVEVVVEVVVVEVLMSVLVSVLMSVSVSVDGGGPPRVTTAVMTVPEREMISVRTSSWRGESPSGAGVVAAEGILRTAMCLWQLPLIRS